MKLSRLFTMTCAGVVLLAGSAGAKEWRVPGHFKTIQAAIDSPAVHAGDVIQVGPGHHAGATVSKAVTIEGRGRSWSDDDFEGHGASRGHGSRGHGETRIDDGPVVNDFGKAGFLFPGDGKGSGAVIKGFSFVKLAFAVFSRGADDVTVAHNSIASTLQAVTNWGNGSWGNRWEISENVVHDLRTDCGGGIGILIGDFQGGTLSGNLVARNTVFGRVRVPADDCGGYNAPGILLYADFRNGAAGAKVEENVVTKNRVFLRLAGHKHGADPGVTVSAIELTDSRDDENETPVIQKNVVNYNDLRGTAVPFAFHPDNIDEANVIANNLTGPGSPPDLPLAAASPVRSAASPVR